MDEKGISKDRVFELLKTIKRDMTHKSVDPGVNVHLPP